MPPGLPWEGSLHPSFSVFASGPCFQDPGSQAGHLPRSSVVSLMSLLSLRAGGFWLVLCLVLPLSLLFFFFLVVRTSISLKLPLGSIPKMVGAPGSHVPSFPTVPTEGIHGVIPPRSRLVSLTSPSRALVPSLDHPDLWSSWESTACSCMTFSLHSVNVCGFAAVTITSSCHPEELARRRPEPLRPMPGPLDRLS